MNSVARTIGKGQSKRGIISSLALTVIIVFYPLSVGSYFEPDIFRFEDRLTYHQYFEGRYFFNEFIDHIIISLGFLIWSVVSFQNRFIKLITALSMASIVLISVTNNFSTPIILLSLVALPFIIAINILEKALYRSTISYQSHALTMGYVLISVAILSVFSIFVSVSSSNINDPFIDMFVLLSRFSPVIMFLLIFSVPLKIILYFIGENVPRLGNIFQNTADSFELVYTKISRYRSSQLGLILAALMTLSIIMILIPNTDSIRGPIGEDTVIYVNWTEDLQASTNLDQISHKSFVVIQDGDRPLSLFLIYLMSLFFPLSSVTLIELVLPTLLAPALVLTIYFLAKELTPNIFVVLFACFITAISFQVIAGMYAGLLANWIALLPSYISLIFLIRFLKTSRKLYLFLFTISLVILLLTHTYTWTIIIIFVFLFGIVLWVQKKYSSNLIKLVFVALIIVIAVDLVKSIITGSTLGLTRDLVLAEATNFGFTQFDLKWSNLVHVTQVHMAGIFGSIVLLLLAFYGTVLIKYKSIIGIFVLVFISIAILPLFFAGEIILSRVLFDIPFQIPVGLAMTNIFLSNGGKLKIIAVILSLLALSVYAMFNLASIEQNI